MIGIDIDGVLTIETVGHDYENRTPNKKMIAKVNEWAEQNHMIVLYSARWESDREITIQWLKKYNVKYTFLLLDKPPFDLYIDDIAYRPEEFYKEENNVLS